MADAERQMPLTTYDDQSNQFSITNKNWFMSAENTRTTTETASTSSYHSYIPNFD
jgi:hypothetical protein